MCVCVCVFGIRKILNVFFKSLLLIKVALIKRKYRTKPSKTVKYFCKFKNRFSTLTYSKTPFISMIKAEFSASLLLRNHPNVLICLMCLFQVARWEHRTRGLTRLFGGPYVACYSLAVLILLLNVYRSHR